MITKLMRDNSVRNEHFSLWNLSLRAIWLKKFSHCSFVQLNKNNSARNGARKVHFFGFVTLINNISQQNLSCSSRHPREQIKKKIFPAAGNEVQLFVYSEGEWNRNGYPIIDFNSTDTQRKCKARDLLYTRSYRWWRSLSIFQLFHFKGHKKNVFTVIGYQTLIELVIIFQWLFLRAQVI